MRTLDELQGIIIHSLCGCSGLKASKKGTEKLLEDTAEEPMIGSGDPLPNTEASKNACNRLIKEFVTHEALMTLGYW